MNKRYLLIFILFMTACDGNDRAPLGSACTEKSVCEGVCNLGLPGGMCTQACSETEPCASGVCVFFGEGSYCLPECETNADCREGYGCIDFFCAPQQPVGARCDDTPDCLPCDGQQTCPPESDLACMENVCSIPCGDQTDCVEGTMCAESSEVFWCVGIDFETGPGTLGADCSVADCVDGLTCRQLFSLSGELSMCTQECNLDRECPPTMGCRLDETGAKWCHPRQFCETCQLDSQCGYTGDLCLFSADSSAKYCSMECDPGLAGTCPADTECQAVMRCADDNGWVSGCDACSGGCDEGTVRYQCVHLQGACIGDGSACTGCLVDGQCGEGLSCVRGPDAWQSTCAQPCVDLGDCPDGLICDPLEGNGFCVPRTGSCTAPSGDQDFCEVCTKPADCLRGLCAQLEGDTSGFSYCLDVPGDDNDCGFFAEVSIVATGNGVFTLCTPVALVDTCPHYRDCLAQCPNGPGDCAAGPAYCQ
ncbi:hypothetical protein KKD52_01515 [Myxococcota bacterium]|nr:hypothetical protein [Myxococcota bacterium]MBU1411139.1 hypothetical protein [Myxococcota bacterium]MBU1509010.1 hypothetical protein [Myxococcota bacterium]